MLEYLEPFKWVQTNELILNRTIPVRIFGTI